VQQGSATMDLRRQLSFISIQNTKDKQIRIYATPLKCIHPPQEHSRRYTSKSSYVIHFTRVMCYTRWVQKTKTPYSCR